MVSLLPPPHLCPLVAGAGTVVPPSLLTHLGPHSTVWDTGSLWPLSRLHSTLLLRELTHSFIQQKPTDTRHVSGTAPGGRGTEVNRKDPYLRGASIPTKVYLLQDGQQVWLLRNQPCSPPCSLLPSSPDFSPSQLSPGVWAFLMTQLVKNPAIQEIKEARV